MNNLAVLLPLVLLGCASQPEIQQDRPRITVMSQEEINQSVQECKFQKRKPLSIYVKRKSDKQFVVVNVVCV